MIQEHDSPQADEKKKPSAYEAYQALAEAYAACIETKPHNAYIANYFATTPVSYEWRGLRTKVTMPNYFHSLGCIAAAMTDNGFAIEKIGEPLPTEAFKKADWQEYANLMKFPGFICFRASKL